ncbi:hypothetical protein PUN28_016685 [Cardiocondyla obscurior]|uniref:Uncharacterized protein n=1 Tax=Cardiocondyla obscurior TaxID=286306 RepID=A0AAW2EQL5_9HYME
MFRALRLVEVPIMAVYPLTERDEVRNAEEPCRGKRVKNYLILLGKGLLVFRLFSTFPLLKRDLRATCVSANSVDLAGAKDISTYPSRNVSYPNRKDTFNGRLDSNTVVASPAGLPRPHIKQLQAWRKINASSSRWSLRFRDDYILLKFREPVREWLAFVQFLVFIYSGYMASTSSVLCTARRCGDTRPYLFRSTHRSRV